MEACFHHWIKKIKKVIVSFCLTILILIQTCNSEFFFLANLTLKSDCELISHNKAQFWGGEMTMFSEMGFLTILS